MSSCRRFEAVVLPLLLLFIGVCQRAEASRRWIRVSTDHFEMYTENSEKQAADALQVFEQVRFFFLRNSKHPEMFEEKARIIAFSSESDYKPYRLNPGSFAFYAPGYVRDYIVMQDVQPEHHQAAVHEYTHLMINHLKLDPPVWLNEGMAELYSSLEPQGNTALVGRALPGRVMSLMRQPWMDLHLLFQVDHDSPYYNQPEKMDIFYAQSWALTHMLTLSPAYMAGFSRLLQAVSSGISTADALQRVYGRSVTEVSADLKKYMHQNTLRAAVFDVALSNSTLAPHVEELSGFDKELVLAELLTTKLQTAPEAQRRLMALEQQRPNSPDVEISLGYLAWQRADLEGARSHFGAAVDAGSKNPKVLFHYAELLQGASAGAGRMEELLAQVLVKQPDNLEARLLLVSTLLNGRSYGRALSTLAAVGHVPPEQAFEFFALGANARANLRDYRGARTSARQALQYAKTAEQRQQVQQLLEFVDEASEASAVTALTAPRYGRTEHDESFPPVNETGDRFSILSGVVTW